MNKKVDIMWDYLFPGASVYDVPRPVPVKYFLDRGTGQMKSVELMPERRRLFSKISEELIEAAEAYGEYVEAPRDIDGTLKDHVAEEIMDIAFAAYTALSVLGYDEDERDELCRRIYEKNKARGYYGEI